MLYLLRKWHRGSQTHCALSHNNGRWKARTTWDVTASLIHLSRSSLAIEVKPPDLKYPGSILILYERAGTYIYFLKSSGYLKAFQSTIWENRYYIVDFKWEVHSGYSLPLWWFLSQLTVGRRMCGSTFSAHCLLSMYYSQCGLPSLALTFLLI